MQWDQEYLLGLVGKPVSIRAAEEGPTPPVILEDVTVLGIVTTEPSAAHFVPWPEVEEITPAELAVTSAL